jgi:hypothetical protein
MTSEQKQYIIEFIFADSGQIFRTGASMTGDGKETMERLLDKYAEGGVVEHPYVAELKPVEQGFDAALDEIREAIDNDVHDDTRNKCQNCDREWPDSMLITPIPDLEQRAAPGEIMPSGECPACGAVCHLIDEED